MPATKNLVLWLGLGRMGIIIFLICRLSVINLTYLYFILSLGHINLHPEWVKGYFHLQLGVNIILNHCDIFTQSRYQVRKVWPLLIPR